MHMQKYMYYTWVDDRLLSLPQDKILAFIDGVVAMNTIQFRRPWALSPRACKAKAFRSLQLNHCNHHVKQIVGYVIGSRFTGRGCSNCQRCSVVVMAGKNVAVIRYIELFTADQLLSFHCIANYLELESVELISRVWVWAPHVDSILKRTNLWHVPFAKSLVNNNYLSQQLHRNWREAC